MIVDPDEGAGAKRVAAIDENQRIIPVHRRAKAGTGHGADENIAARQLRPHGFEVFVLQFGAIMGVAQDHDIAGIAQRILGRGCDGRHRGVVEVRGQHGDDLAFAPPEAATRMVRAIAKLGHDAPHALHRVRRGAAKVAIDDARDGCGRNTGGIRDIRQGRGENPSSVVPSCARVSLPARL